MTKPPPTPPKDHRLSRPDLAAQFVHDIMKQRVEDVKQTRAATTRSQRRRSAARHLLWVVPIFVGLTVWNAWTWARPAVVFTEGQMSASRKFGVYLAVEAVKDYQRTHGVLPTSLAAAGVVTRGLAYAPLEPAFTISDTTGRDAVTYHSGDNLAPFASAYRRLLRRSGGSSQ